MPAATWPRVFLADDSSAIRQRVAALLDAHQLPVVGQAGTPQACIEGILTSHAEVVVLDIQLEGGTGLQVLQAVHASAPQVAFVVFSNSAQRAYRQRYLGAGAAGFLDKSTDFEALPAAIQAAARVLTPVPAPSTPEPGANPRH